MPKFLGAGRRRESTIPKCRCARGSIAQALQTHRRRGGGQYFELDRDGDRHIANAIIDAGKRLAPTLGVTEQAEELYWCFISFAAAFVALGVLFLRERAQLWIQMVAAVVLLATLSTILG